MCHSRRLQTESVNVSFDGVRALSEVFFDLRSDEIEGLIGPNGAGKTTLVNVLSGFQKPDSGQVLMGGRDVTFMSPHLLSRYGIARTFQAGRLFAMLSVCENVAVSAVGTGLTRKSAFERAKGILEWIGMGDKLELPAAALAYADQRRVGIARSLALQPHFVLLDEPAAGMSEAECDELVECIQEIPERYHCGVLLIEHNMSVVRGVCSRVHVLDGGCTIAVGSPIQIQRDPAVVAAYLGTQTGNSSQDANS